MQYPVAVDSTLMIGTNPGWTEITTAIGTGILAFAAVIGLIGLYVARNALDETAKARHALVFTELARRWEDRDMRDVRASIFEMNADEFKVHYEELYRNNPFEALKLQRIGSFFEDLGVFVKLECFKIEWIEESLGSAVCNYWDVWKTAIDDDREPDMPELEWRENVKSLYANWETLAKNIEKRKIEAERLQRKTSGRKVFKKTPLFKRSALRQR